MVEHLLECGASVHAKDDGGLIPLHNACSFGHAEVVQLLLRSGADANARDNWNYTPLHEAAIKGKIDVCIGEFLFECQSLDVFWWRFLGNMTKNLFLTKIIWFCGIDKQIIWIAFLKFCQKSYENQKTWFCKHLKYGLNMKWQDNNPTSIVKAVLLLEKQASLIDDHAELKTSSIDFFQTQCLQSQKTRYFHPYIG